MRAWVPNRILRQRVYIGLVLSSSRVGLESHLLEVTYAHQGFLQLFGGLCSKVTWSSRAHKSFQNGSLKPSQQLKAPKAKSFSEIRGAYPTHTFLLLTPTGSSFWSLLAAKSCLHTLGFILPWKIYHAHCCLANPPALSVPPVPWARLASTLPTLSGLPSDIITCVLCQAVPAHELTWHEGCTLFIFLPFPDVTTMPVT